jgi:hypothetical protein
MSDTALGGPNPLAELIAGVRRRIPQPDARQGTTAVAAAADNADEAQWTELAAAVDELVEVVLVQQDLIENLLVRMSRLEGRDVSAPKAGKARRGA